MDVLVATNNKEKLREIREMLAHAPGAPNEPDAPNEPGAPGGACAPGAAGGYGAGKAKKNAGGARAAAQQAGTAGFRVLSLADVGISAELPETGSTFEENALMKAVAA
ncbi:MAG: hypothetical protein LBJ10_08320, partial [Clostridiales bacterium]|nr:hypothetical protein [Clostridiales bacterium]